MKHEAGELPRQPQARQVTWFGLFFDLVFVVAIAQLRRRSPITSMRPAR